MASNDYHFITHWKIKADRDEVADIICNAVDLVRWWPSVYLGADLLKKGDEHGLGNVVALYTKGWLPYTLHWQFEVTAVDFPRTLTIVAEGDFVGRGIWTFTQEGAYVDVKYDWKIKAEMPLLRYFSVLMKPIFSANHHWAMDQGEKSIKLELARRHAASAAERERIPAPPGPTPSGATYLRIFAALAGAFVVYRRLTRDNTAA